MIAWLLCSATMLQAEPPSPAPVVQVGGETGGRLGRSTPEPLPQPQQPATGQAPLQPLAVTQLEDRARLGDLDARIVSLRVAEGRPVVDVLLQLVRDSGFSLVPDPEVSGRFVGDLERVTLRQALELVLRPLGFDYAVQDRSIRVFRRQMETRFFEIDALDGARAARRWPSASAAERVVPADSGTPAVFDEIVAGVRALATEPNRVHLDRRAGVLQVTDYPERLDRVRLYLDTALGRLGRQVAIAAEVIEIEFTEPSAASVDWAAVWRAVGAGGRAAPSPGTGPVTSLLEAEALPRLRAALALQGRLRVVAAPRAVAAHLEPLWLRVATDQVIFVPTWRFDETTGRPVQATMSPQVLSEGVLLSVTPAIAADGVVHLHISPRVAERAGVVTARSGEAVPVLSVREADTVVRAYDGELVLIAGLTGERTEVRRSRAPIVGTLPLLGRTFSTEARRTVRTELVVLLAASIVTPGRTAGATIGAPR